MLNPTIKARLPAFPMMPPRNMPVPPLAPLQPLLALALRLFLRRHPEVFDRLSSLPNPLILIDPEDMPLQFLLHCSPDAPKLKALRRGSPARAGQDSLEGHAAAVIRGPLPDMLELLQGENDGDSLFFSRRLAVEGDMETVVALRNALDAEEIDLIGEICSFLGPLGPAAQRLMRRIEGILVERARNDTAEAKQTGMGRLQ